MKSVITKMEKNEDASVWGVERFDVEIKDSKVPNVIVERRTDPNNGFVSVLVQVPVVARKPVLSLSTMDAIARRILPDARVYAGNHVTAESRVQVRRYTSQ